MSGARYLAAAVPARLANAGSNVVLPLLAIERTGDVALGGFLIAASLAPSVLAAPVVGALLDRSRVPRRWLVGAGLVSAGGFAVASLLGDVPLVVVVLALLVSGCASPFSMGGLSSFVPDSFPDRDRGYAADALAYNVGAVAGPAVGGVLAAGLGARPATLLLATVCVIGAIGAATMAVRPHVSRERSGLWSEVRTGLRFIVGHRPIAVITASATVNQLGAGGLAIAALVLTVQRGDRPEHSAWIVTAFAVGALIGSAVLAARPFRRRLALVMPLSFAASGALLIVGAADLGFAWTVVLIGIAGVCIAPGAASLLALRTRYSPPEVRSQVFTVGSGLRASAAAAGAALAGVLSGWDGTLLLVLVGAVGGLAAGAIMLAFPRDAEPVDPAD